MLRLLLVANDNGDMNAPYVTPVPARHRHPVRRAGALLALSILVTLTGAAPATAVPSPNVPPSLVVPAGNVLYLVGHARGYQIYVCQPQPGGGYAWVLQAPWAGLVDDSGRWVALHYGGPSWRAPDNSVIVAARVAGSPAPSSTAIPWLLLSVTSRSGPPGGLFSATTYIQRINTTGGLAPAAGCDAAHVGALAPVFYTADYYFYRAG